MVNGLEWVVLVGIIEERFTYMVRIIGMNLAPKPKCSRTCHKYSHSKAFSASNDNTAHGVSRMEASATT
jgi:hypothetical protein